MSLTSRSKRIKTQGDETQEYPQQDFNSLGKRLDLANSAIDVEQDHTAKDE